MKTIAIAVGSLLAAAATSVPAQVFIERTYDPYASGRSMYLDSRDECWNPGAGHFEGVRPGEQQDDLDFSRCRRSGERYYENRYENRYEGRRWGNAREECWNPRAGHYEEVRRGEYQGDLDFGRCRAYRF